MKKNVIVIVIVGLLFSVNIMAQKTGGTTFGVRAGVNFQNVNGKYANGDKLDNKLKTGFNIGVNAEIPVATEFYFQPGLLFSTKGFKNTFLGKKLTVNYSYIELPLNFLYKGVLGTNKVLLGFGPYLAYGISGSQKYDGGSAKVKFQNNQGTDLSVAYVKPFDAGANFLVGYELANKISFQLNAQLGLVNIQASPEGKEKSANTGFGLSVGYRF